MQHHIQKLLPHAVHSEFLLTMWTKSHIKFAVDEETEGKVRDHQRLQVKLREFTNYSNDFECQYYWYHSDSQ